MEKLNIFMYIYMYELEKYLLEKKDEILKISFQSDEANTDRPLKEYLKNIIKNEISSLPSSSEINKLKIENLTKDTDEIKSYIIEDVLLPEEISNEIKNKIKEKKNSVYTNPDICLKISDSKEIYYETIELKSTKNDSIPGSSIQQINPEEWVIFIKHTKQGIDVTTGKYINSINSKIQFPDRSPRPQVSFNELKNWNNTNRKVINEIIFYEKDKDLKEKYLLIEDWQNVLSNRWLSILFEFQKVKTKEPWFNTNLRKFILKFLDKYESLEKKEKENFRKKIKEILEKDLD